MQISNHSTSERLKALGDPTRLRIFTLLEHAPLCVCSIEQVLGISQTSASRHLARLQTAGILASERRAQWVYYSIDEQFACDHAPLLEYLFREARGSATHREDRQRLENYMSDEALCKPTPAGLRTPRTIHSLTATPR